VVLWELYTTEEPYKGLFDSLDELIEAVALDEERPEMPDDCPPLLKKLIVSCWQTDPALRYHTTHTTHTTHDTHNTNMLATDLRLERS
jgi:hypothetical protein